MATDFADSSAAPDLSSENQEKLTYAQQKELALFFFKEWIVDKNSFLNECLNLSNLDYSLISRYLPSNVGQNAFDLAFRNCILWIVEEMKTLSEPDKNMYILHFMNLFGWLVCSKSIKIGRIFSIFEDLFECCSLETCEMWFDYIEEKCPWIPHFSRMIKQNETGPVVRCFQGMLRRLYNTNKPVFCGRILSYISHLIPFSHPSGTNKTGKINLGNVTHYDESPDASQIVNPIVTDKLDLKMIDESFYKTFWKLEDLVHRALSTSNCKELSTIQSISNAMSQVLDVFELTSNFLIKNSNVKEESTDGGKENIHEICMIAEDKNLFFPKYLSSFKLTKLKILEPQFRSQILVQYCLFLHSLKELKAVPQKPSNNEPSSDAAETIVSNLMNRALKLLSKNPHNGEMLTSSLPILLQREEWWIEWKKNKCLDFQKHPLKVPIGFAPPWKKRKFSDSLENKDNDEDDSFKVSDFQESLIKTCSANIEDYFNAAWRKEQANSTERISQESIKQWMQDGKINQCFTDSLLLNSSNKLRSKLEHTQISPVLSPVWNELFMYYGGMSTLKEIVESLDGESFSDHQVLSWKLRRSVIMSESLTLYSNFVEPRLNSLTSFPKKHTLDEFAEIATKGYPEETLVNIYKADLKEFMESKKNSSHKKLKLNNPLLTTVKTEDSSNTSHSPITRQAYFTACDENDQSHQINKDGIDQSASNAFLHTNADMETTEKNYETDMFEGPLELSNTD